MTAAASPPIQRRFNRRDAKTLGLSALGGALEFYDFVVFVFFAKTLGALFFPPGTAPWLAQLQVYGIFAAGYVARPLGGIVMAHFGDRLGRKRMFTLSVFMMSVPTLLIGLLPTHAQVGALAPLLVLTMRIVQGIAVGGEVPGAWVFVAEHVPRSRVGIACATLTAGLTAGILIGSLLAAWINTRYSAAEVQAWVWRVPFLIGGVFGFVAVWLRRWLEETPVFVEMRERRQLARQVPVKQVLAAHRPAVVLSILASWQLTAAIVVIVLLTPTLVQTSFGIAPAVAFHGNSLATLALVFGCLAAGGGQDRRGARAAVGFAGIGRGGLRAVRRAAVGARSAVRGVVHAGRLLLRRGRRDADADGRGVPTGSAIFRSVVFLQRGVRGVWRADPAAARLVVEGMGAAGPGALCGLHLRCRCRRGRLDHREATAALLRVTSRVGGSSPSPPPGCVLSHC